MASIQILSDLHLEFPDNTYEHFDIVPKAPYLALLGDIGNVVAHQQPLMAFLTKQLQQFKAVLFVPGNHETYGSTWNEAMEVLKDFEQDVKKRLDKGETRPGHSVLLDRAVFELPTDGNDRVVILGCSLFSYIPPLYERAVEMGLQDFYETNSWDTHQHNEAHRRDLAWLNERVAQYQQEDSNVRIVILTHWSPTTDPRSIAPKHQYSNIMHGFATDLSDEICYKSEKVVLWAFGHTHYNCDVTVERADAGPLRLMTNQRGYYFALSPRFDGEKIVEL